MHDPKLHRRRSIRLRDVHYSGPGGYFVTICTDEKVCLFGQVLEGEMRSNEFGRMAEACWLAIPEHIPHVELDAFVVMPNHVHGIIGIVDTLPNDAQPSDNVDIRRGAACCAPTRANGQMPEMNERIGPGSLGTIMRSYKSAVTKRINEIFGTPGAPVWQRNYYEHIIRNGRDLERIRRYIAENPARWRDDRYTVGA